jgi:pyridoxine/pyridoxamine 5'-phosphate oxidase
MDVRNLASLYELPPVDWAAIQARLDRGLTLAPDTGGEGRQACWLTTINADGSPHVNGIGALWVDGTFWFVTGERSRKGRNLAGDPRCAMSVSTDEFDLVVEGTAEKVTDPATVEKLAAIWAAGGWPARPDDTGEALTA